MFVAHEVILDLSFRVARARLLALTAGDGLSAASAEAFAEGHAELVRIAPFRGVPGVVNACPGQVRAAATRGGIISVPVR
jgi:hypothetical protein